MKCECGTCTTCRSRERMRRWREANGDRERARERASYAANPARGRAKARRWREANPEKASQMTRSWQARNRERMQDKHRDWVANNRERMREHYSLRRAREKGSYAEPINRQAVYERDGGRCHICGKAADRDNFHLDHLIPVSRGGEHGMLNVRVAHPSCNIRRHAGRLPAQLLLV